MSNKVFTKFSKICSVCGEKAIGYNFCAITCESCKAFFRRNATKLNDYKCPFQDNCNIDLVTRKCCRKCRLKKCFSVGMKREWILTEEEKQIRRNKVYENRKRRQSLTDKTGEYSSDASSQLESDTNDSQNLNNNNVNTEQIISNTMEIEKYVPNNEKLSTNHNKSIVESKDNEEIYESTYERTVEFELSVLPIPKQLDNNFNEVECNRMIELLNATVVFNSNYPTYMITTGKFEDLTKFFVNKFEHFAKKFIKVVKNINSFDTLCENDQIALIKYSTLEVLYLRTAIYYSLEKEQWTFNMNNISIIFKLEVLKHSSNTQYEYQVYRNYLNQICKEWDNDSFIIDLLMTILVFNPDRPNIIHKEPIKLQQHLYMYLLKRYLQLKYVSECESKVKFLRIINVIQDIQKLNEINRLDFKRVNPHLLGPLLAEILDINSDNQS